MPNIYKVRRSEKGIEFIPDKKRMEKRDRWYESFAAEQRGMAGVRKIDNLLRAEKIRRAQLKAREKRKKKRGRY